MSEDDAGAADAVAAYKRLLQAVCDNRPSGMRGRLAAALGTNRSFVSQMTSPAYAMPIPAPHLNTIFEVCHLSATERAAFLEAFDRAHPGRRKLQDGAVQTRMASVRVPDFGDAQRNKAVDDFLASCARHLAQLVAAGDE